MRRVEQAVALLAIVVSATSLAVKLQRRPQIAGDLVLACGAASAMKNGEDPYNMAVLTRYSPTPGIPMAYPPLAARAFVPACGPIHHAVIWTALAVATVVILRGLLPLALPTVVAVVFAGFGAFEWAVLTGNPSIVELPLMALAFLAFARQRSVWFGAAIAVLAYLKLAPAAYLAAGLARLGVRLFAVAAVAAVFLFAALHGLSVWLHPAFTRSYWHVVRTGFNGFVKFERHDGGQNHPALISLAHDLAAVMGLGDAAAAAIYSLAAVAVAAAAVVAWRSRASRREIESAAIVVLLVAIVTPRLKPYAFGALVPALAVVLSGLGGRRAVALLVTTCIAPTLALAVTAIVRPDPFSHPATVYKMLFGYMQLYGAAAAVLLTLLPQRSSVGTVSRLHRM